MIFKHINGQWDTQFKIEKEDRKFGNKSGKKRIDASTKTWNDALKIALRRGVQKAVEATSNSIGNETADKITSKSNKSNNVDKISTEPEKVSEIPQRIYTSPEKHQQIINDLRLF